MRVAFLWVDTPPYLVACLRTLASDGSWCPDLYVLRGSDRESAPAFHYFPGESLDFAKPIQLSHAETMTRVGATADCTIACGWHVVGIMKIVRRHHGSMPLVLTLDNQPNQSFRQLLGFVYGRMYLSRLFDAVFCPGERQRQFSRSLGFSDARIWSGLYCGDVEMFNRTLDVREPRAKGMFLYAGRYAQEKGLEDLVSAVRLYRKREPEPWDVHACGEGPLRALLEEERIYAHSHLAPKELSALLRSADCFILPSRFEPWGVVVHEAAAAGLPIIATAAVGSSPHLVEDGANGFVVPAKDPEALADALVTVHRATAEERQAMGRLSQSLASRYTPQIWSKNLSRRLDQLTQGTVS